MVSLDWENAPRRMRLLSVIPVESDVDVAVHVERIVSEVARARAANDAAAGVCRKKQRRTGADAAWLSLPREPAAASFPNPIVFLDRIRKVFR